jgi:DNA-binding transcriptional LysR family regulator
MLSQRSLEAFHATMITGSVSGAADMLNVSQPAVSRLIRDLEQALQIDLFLRMGGKVVPTPEARELALEVERAFIGLTTIERAAMEIRRGRRAAISVAAMPALSQTILPDVLIALRRKMPTVQIELMAMQTQDVIRQVASRQCQIGFTSPTRQQFEVDLLQKFDLPYRCILPAGHDLADKEVIEISDLDGRDFVSFNASTATGQMLDRIFAGRQKPPVVTVRSHLSPVIGALVARGMGVGIVDPFTAQEFARAGGVSRPVTLKEQFSCAVVRPLGQKLTSEIEILLSSFEERIEATLAAG